MAEEDVKEQADADVTEETATEETTVDEKLAEQMPPTEPSTDWKDQYLRLRAEFDNYKKRMARERDEVYRYAEGEIIKDILPTVDNLTLALSKVENAEDPFVKGVQLVSDTLLAMLKKHEAESFESVGQPLDVEKMEAIAQMPHAEIAEGLVSTEVKRGWMLKGKVLRAAQVVVSAGQPSAPEEK